MMLACFADKMSTFNCWVVGIPVALIDETA